jgi:Tfp pilus assembly protein PilV
MAKILRKLARLKTRAQDQRGLGLVETLVAVAILGTSVAAFAAALSAGSIAVDKQGEAAVAQSLVQTQMEYTKSYPYNPAAVTYPAVAPPAGYTIAVGVTSVPGTDADIQKITVTVSRAGLSLITLADYKMNR